MSIRSLFEMTRRSFQAMDAAMNVAGQNIANANTEGYARRRVVLQSDSNATTGIHSRPHRLVSPGIGVSIQSFERLRDGMLRGAAWRAQGKLGYADEQHRLMTALEGVIPSDAGSLTDSLHDFWNAWSDLADNPSDKGVRLSLRANAAALSNALNTVDANLRRLQEQSAGELKTEIDGFNEKLDEIVDLNGIITRARNLGTPDFSAEDQRDRLVSELSTMANINVIDGRDGFAVHVGGIAVVQGDSAIHLRVDEDNGTVFFGNSAVGFPNHGGGGGKIEALIEASTSVIDDAVSTLDDFASALVREVNELHEIGYGLDGSTTGISFFDPAATTAASMRLSDEVLADAGMIAASGETGALGDNSIALAIAALQNEKLLAGGTVTLGSRLINLSADIGSKLASSAKASDAQSLVVAHLESMEKGVSGVSTDEELTKIIELQRSYGATAKVLTAAQSMMDTLLAM